MRILITAPFTNRTPTMIYLIYGTFFAVGVLCGAATTLFIVNSELPRWDD